MNDDIIINNPQNEIPAEDSSVYQESYIRKFHSFAKEFMEIELNNNHEPIQKVRETSRFISFGLPANLNEVFIRSEESYILWVLDIPLNSYIEDYFKLYFSKSSGFEFFKLVKESYQKWVFNRSLSEKKYFARSFLSLAEKNFAGNFYFFLLLSSVYANEKSVLNYSKAREALEKAKESFTQTKISEPIREVLTYYINLFEGFTYLKENGIQSANDRFTEAIRINPFGITAKFYLALSEIRLNHKEVAQHLVNEIINFDRFRCTYAINEHNSGMLNHFVKFPVIQNIFYYDDFSSISEFLEEFFVEIQRNFSESYHGLIIRIKKLEELKISEYYTQEARGILSFIGQVINMMGKSKSIIFYNAYPDMHSKLGASINNIAQAIKEKYYTDVKDRLVVFNSQIEEKVKESEKLKTDQEEYLKKLKDKLNEAIKIVEVNASSQISNIEDKINNINNVQNLNPKNSFTKSMTYNVIVSVLAFMMGGCAGYTNTFMYSMQEFKDVIGTILFSGLKWGGIAFFSGILISFGFTGFIVMERSNEKQKYLKSISYIKEQKDRQIETYNRDFATTEKTITGNFGKRIADRNEEARLLGLERDNQEKIYLSAADEKIQAEVNRLQALL